MAMPPPPITSQGSPPTEEEIIPGHTELSLEADEIDNLGVNTATDGVHDNESTYDAGSDTTSIWSDIFGYRVKNGRTYHSYKADSRDYYLPNDERENDRLDIIHNSMVKMIGGKLHLCPVGEDKPVKRVLDCGTGTGVWALDFADEHPDAQIVGVDLSPIQHPFAPPNVEWFVDDIEEDWTYQTHFDFVYMRQLVGSIRNWPRLFQQAFEHLNPGGWIEVFEPRNPLESQDGTLPPDSALLKWSNSCFEASVKLGTPMDSGLYHKQRLLDAGFVNVVQKDLFWPTNPWPKDEELKELGAWCYEAMSTGLQAISLGLLTNVLGWDVVEVEVLLVQVRKELKDPRIHAYWPVTLVYGQKPE